MSSWILLLILHGLASYLVARQGTKRKIGFENAFLLSLVTSPVIGYLFVLDSRKLEEDAWKDNQIPDGYPQEVRIAYSRLLTDFRDGDISQEEFEQKKAELLARG